MFISNIILLPFTFIFLHRLIGVLTTKIVTNTEGICISSFFKTYSKELTHKSNMLKATIVIPWKDVYKITYKTIVIEEEGAEGTFRIGKVKRIYILTFQNNEITIPELSNVKEFLQQVSLFGSGKIEIVCN